MPVVERVAVVCMVGTAWQVACGASAWSNCGGREVFNFRVGSIPQRRAEWFATSPQPSPHFVFLRGDASLEREVPATTPATEDFFVLSATARHPSARLSRNKFVRSADGEALDSIASTH